MNKLLYLTASLLMLSSFTYRYADEIKNYYGISDILTFDNIQYKLSASYHPNDVYYKQEYIPEGELVDHFNTMVIIDFVITDAPAKQMLKIKAKELDDRKKNDVVVHYEIMENADQGEYMLDFILSESKGDKVSIVERNVYRYKNYTDKSGHKGILLFAISQRGYDDGITDFFGNLKKNRIADINKVGAYDLPVIEIK